VIFDTALAIRSARNSRIALAGDASEGSKWASVLVLAVMSQVSVAVAHLEKIHAQIAAIAILTVSLIVVIGILAAYELPFAPPLGVSPSPIAHVLDVVPRG
jgi:hypothetical protein